MFPLHFLVYSSTTIILIQFNQIFLCMFLPCSYKVNLRQTLFWHDIKMAIANILDGDSLSNLNHLFLTKCHSHQDPKSGLMTSTRRAEVSQLCKYEFQWIVFARDACSFKTESEPITYLSTLLQSTINSSTNSPAGL